MLCALCATLYSWCKSCETSIQSSARMGVGQSRQLSTLPNPNPMPLTPYPIPLPQPHAFRRPDAPSSAQGFGLYSVICLTRHAGYVLCYVIIVILCNNNNNNDNMFTGICGILGSTYTGEYEDIEKLDQLVEKLNKEKVPGARHKLCFAFATSPCSWRLCVGRGVSHELMLQSPTAEHLVAVHQSTCDPKGLVQLNDAVTAACCSLVDHRVHAATELLHMDVDTMHACREVVCVLQGFDVKIHVDAASGGFVAPFVEPDLKWDFRLKNVVSINTSGHK